MSRFGPVSPCATVTFVSPWCCHALNLGGEVEERIPIANDRLWDELLTLRPDTRVLADRGAYRHHLNQAAAQLVDVDLDPDDAIGAQFLGLGTDVLQAVLPRVVDEAGDLVDLAAAEGLEKRR